MRRLLLMKNTLNSLNIMLISRNCGVNVAKIGFERLSGVGFWLVPSEQKSRQL